MRKFDLSTAFAVMIIMAVSLTSCQAIEGIFKAGVWVGVIAVIVVIVIIFWIISKVGKK